MVRAVIHRLISGGGVGAAWAVGLLFLPSPGLFAALLICSTLCQWEFYKLAEQGGYATCRPIGLALGGWWLSAVFAFSHGTPPPTGGFDFLAGDRWEGLLIAGAGLLLLVRLLFDARVTRPLEAAGITLLGIFYVPFMLSYYIRLAQWDATAPLMLGGGGIFLAFYASLVVKLSDIGGYAMGMWLGRHKMFSRISPAKSWEGLAGGMTLSVIGSVVVVAVAHAHAWTRIPVTPLSHLGYPLAVALGLLFGGIGVVGDLVESMFKRAVNAKDSSSILPGMGGLLDVFDSLLFAPAVMYFLLPLL